MADRPTLALLARPFWNAEERRVRALWRVLAVAAALGLARLVIGATLFVLTSATPAAGSGTWASVTLLAAWGAQLWAGVASVVLAALFLDRRRLADLGLRFDRSARADLAFGLALGAGLMAGIFAAERAMGWIAVEGAWRPVDPSIPFAAGLVVPLIAFVAVGLYEELAFRGYLLRNLAEGFRCGAVAPRVAVAGAVALSSAVFGLLHAGNPAATAVSTANIALAGIVLSLGYVLTGRLALPVGFHVTWNLFQNTVFGFPVSGVTALETTILVIRQDGPELWTGGRFGPEAGLLGVLALGTGALLTVLWVRLQTGRAVLDASLAEPPRRGNIPAVAGPGPAPVAPGATS